MPPAPEEPPPGPRTPAGMCEADWKRVAGETPTKAEELERNKVNFRVYRVGGVDVGLLIFGFYFTSKSAFTSKSGTTSIQFLE